MSIFERLAAPIDPARVSWRVGATTQQKDKGLALAYIDARDVMARLDEVCGVDGWQNDYPHANGKTVCRIGIRVKDEWIWKSNGAGDTDVEAEKGALSDAFKRAAVMWGIGRYLYDVPSPWVAIEQHGKSYGIKESELTKLRKLLASFGVDHTAEATGLIAELKRKTTPGALEEWGGAQGIQDKIAGFDEANRERVRTAYGTHLALLKGKERVPA